jgi:Family of unknown function (DUF5330)
MFFLLRVAFWLTIVLALLPSGSSQPDMQPKVSATEAVVAASSAVSDMTGFCDRQPGACVVGAQAASTIAQRAQAGAKMVYEFFNERIAKIETKHETPGETGGINARKSAPAPASHGTLKATDVEPAWQGPVNRGDPVPLPRKAPKNNS